MKKTTRILAMALALVMALGLLPITAGAAFTATRTYKSGQFTDVADSAWFAKDVKKVYELGLMNGNSTTTFNPKGMFTVAEALTVAGRMHHLANGGSGTLPKTSGAWYQGAVNYCLAQGIITRGQFDSYTRNATRAEMAGVVRAALPDGQWKAINSVSALPDVSAGTDYSQAIFDLYNAGVFTGNDKYGMFQPYANITRAEVAAIVARCADPGQRKTLNLKPLSERQAPEIIGGYNYYSGKKMSNGRLAYQDPDTKKWGYLDGSGKVVIAAQYDRVGDFKDGYAVVEKEGKSSQGYFSGSYVYHKGVINTAGTVTVPLEYYKTENLGGGLFRVQKESYSSQYGVVNASGKMIVPNQYGDSAGWTGAYAWGREGWLNYYCDIYSLTGAKLQGSAKQLAKGNPLIAVKEGSKCAVATGSTKLTEAVYDDVELPENSNFAQVTYGNLVGVVCLAGELIAPGTYDRYAFDGDHFAAYNDKEVVVGDATGVLYRAGCSGNLYGLTVYEDEGTFFVDLNGGGGVFFYQNGKSRSVEQLGGCFTWKDEDKVYLMTTAGKVFGPRDEYSYDNYYRDGDSYGIWDETGELSRPIYDSATEAKEAYDKEFYARPENNGYAIRNNSAGKPIVAYGNDIAGWTSVIEFYKNSMYYDEIRELGEGYYACRFNTTWYLLHA